MDPIKSRKKVVARLGYVAQSHQLYRNLNVASHLDLADTLRPGFDRSMAEDRLNQLAIPLFAATGELSGGQQAHVSLVIALASAAPVLLMDEPLASLDPLARHDFLRVLVDHVRTRGGTALLSSHILSDVEQACDRIIILGAGQVMLHGRIAAERAEHRLCDGDVREREEAVASFHRPGGRLVSLLRSTDRSLEMPSLEELVMGYLAAARRIEPAGRPGAARR
jgi:ABC-2 type transport system ATP-binding protein